MRARLLVGAAAAVLTAAVTLLGGALREAGPAASRAAGPAGAPAGAASAELAVAGFAAGDTAAELARLEDAVRAAPDDGASLALLGLTYQQRARETGDAAYLGRSETVLRRALRLDGDDVLALSGLSALAASRHEFGEALRLARRVVAVAPDTARGYGLLGDALLELGRYGEAFRALERMVGLKPSLGAYARVAYARELLGRPRQALEALDLALDASGGTGEPAAWTLVEIGKLHLSLGEPARARRAFRDALAVFPGYAFALEGLARAEAAAGRYTEAAALAKRAADTVPLLQFAATLAEIHEARGDRNAARAQIELVETIERLQRANGVDADLELALFRLDHGLRLRETLALARVARTARPSVHGDDVLAWALARNGRCAAARAYSERSLRLGTRDATFFFHRGMIERCLGRGEEARAWFRRALDTNPHFSLRFAPLARRCAS